MKICSICSSKVENSSPICPTCGSANFILENVEPMVKNGQPTQVLGSMPVQGQPTMQTPMQNQTYPVPSYGTMPVQGNMPMTYATVYMVLVGLTIVSSTFNLFQEFSVGTLAGIVFNCLIVYFLYKRAKAGRILVMIQNVIQAIVGGLVVVVGLLFMIGMNLTVQNEFTDLGNILGIVFIVVGGLVLIYGICSFIYFKKRACMYLN